ncbi:hypothetical protein BKP37_06905 [Anaerobacillus alkalilacustris]|uniref:Spo0E family sporulation regulatory protein-aspartic acid phosphatase n=1 Tax=Anaerobacillus alkalilacustris TaxID=393763 RepID=A0A1S2LSE9_9BACI|nr:aspartyl-phosphate phosphatase Spo0E family protein [Anaerobacillus alkalilacustris]OIJ15140.1 hypothetical protein BKP37_06905 [Anaerobacillus alkalilacustris]
MKKDLKNKKMLEEIEIARKKMVQLAYENPLNSKEVVDASTKLDKLLNVYNNIHISKKTKTLVHS